MVGETAARSSWIAVVALLGALLVPAVPAARAAAPASGSLEAVIAAQARHAAAARKVAALRAQQASLEARISALKKAGDRGPALEALLRRSVQAETTLDAGLADLRRTEARYEGALDRAVDEIDNQIRARAKDLKRGPLAARRRAAQRINALRAERRALRQAAADLTKARKRDKAWAQYRVRVDAKDGPVELSEKADFVEDTRDKVTRKRRALIQLLAEARRDREIAQSARDFRTDVTLFDEETRQGRVLRQGRQTGTSRDQGDPDPVEAAEDGPPGSPNLDGDGVEFSGGTPLSGGPSSQSPALRAINPDVLINLRVEDVAAGALDVATLEKYVADLRKLERFLSGQADALRDRADALQADEDRDLQR